MGLNKYLEYFKAVVHMEQIMNEHDRSFGYQDSKLHAQFTNKFLQCVSQLDSPSIFRNIEFDKFINVFNEAFQDIQNDLLSRGPVNCFSTLMIDQCWKLIQVRLSILIKGVSKRQKWIIENIRIEKDLQIEKLKNDQQEEMVAMNKKIAQ